MRVIVMAAALLGCLSGACRAYDVQTVQGQAICDTLAQIEELSIAIAIADDRYIEDMGSKGCHYPEAGMRISLIEAYADQTVLLFRKLAETTHQPRQGSPVLSGPRSDDWIYAVAGPAPRRRRARLERAGLSRRSGATRLKQARPPAAPKKEIDRK
jgi:hypothetical protein